MMSNSNSQLSSSEQLDRVPNGAQSSSSSSSSSTKAFWDHDGYKEVIKRSQNSDKQLTALKKMLDERAQCEKAYAESLLRWSQSWKKAADQGPEEDNFKEAWLSFTKEADAIRTIHLEIAENLRTVRKSVSDWQSDNYKKSNTLKNIEKGFKNTQDQWSEKLKRVKERQSKYYTACKDEHNIRTKNKTQSAVADQTEEQKRKAQQRENKAHNEALAAQDKYKKAVNELQGDRDRHRRDMQNQFGHAQDFEKTRLNFTKQSMITMSGHLNASAYQQFPAIYPALLNLLHRASVDEDLVAFETKRGVQAELTFPTYQEWTVEMAGPSLSSARGAASLRAVEASVAFGNDKTIESGSGSYRVRSDTSPPSATTRTQTSSSTTSGASNPAQLQHTQQQITMNTATSSSSTSQLSSSHSSSASHLPPPPESTSLPQVPKSVSPTEQSTNSISNSGNKSSTPKQEKTKVVSASANIDNNNSQSASKNKSGTLDITNPFKFNTIQRDDPPPDYDNPFDHGSDHEDAAKPSVDNHVYSSVGATGVGVSGSSQKPVVPPPPPDDSDDENSEDDNDRDEVESDDENEGGYSVNAASNGGLSKQPMPMPRGVSVLNTNQGSQQNLNNNDYESEDDAEQVAADNVYMNELPDPEPPEGGNKTQVNASKSRARHNCGSVIRDDSKVEFEGGVQVRALYTYEADEEDEISLAAGEEFTKLADADENGWAYGFRRERYGLYPASYAEEI